MLKNQLNVKREEILTQKEVEEIVSIFVDSNADLHLSYEPVTFCNLDCNALVSLLDDLKDTTATVLSYLIDKGIEHGGKVNVDFDVLATDLDIDNIFEILNNLISKNYIRYRYKEIMINPAFIYLGHGDDLVTSLVTYKSYTKDHISYSELCL